MTQRTTAVSSEVGEPFELISANPPPITERGDSQGEEASSDTLRGTLRKNRDCERSGPEPLGAGPPLVVTARLPAGLGVS